MDENQLLHDKNIICLVKIWLLSYGKLKLNLALFNIPLMIMNFYNKTIYKHA